MNEHPVRIVLHTPRVWKNGATYYARARGRLFFTTYVNNGCGDSGWYASSSSTDNPDYRTSRHDTLDDAVAEFCKVNRITGVVAIG